MSLGNRRRMLGGKKRNQTIYYLGDTPKMSDDNNSPLSNLVTLRQPAGIDFNYILVVSKDRRAYKELAYRQDTLGSVYSGKVSYNASPYQSYYANSVSLSFTLQSRNSTENIIVGHARMTSTSGNFYRYFPQAFEVYALTLPYEEGDIV